MRLFILLLAMALPMTALAVEPDEMLDDPVLEARAREVSKGLRCVVCLNQDIDSSNAGVARDLRLLVRERIMAGDTNEEATAFIQARYGDYVLLRPPLNAKTYVLWFAPPTLLIIGVGVGWMTLLRRRRKPVQNKLSEAEEQEIKQFIDDQKAGEST
uniref:cytochrome c-type biogenesis protein n=1 Tax=Aliiroseovarius sediminilitoris TaxID=1173584 RepID=UPI003899269C